MQPQRRRRQRTRAGPATATGRPSDPQASVDDAGVHRARQQPRTPAPSARTRRAPALAASAHAPAGGIPELRDRTAGRRVPAAGLCERRCDRGHGPCPARTARTHAVHRTATSTKALAERAECAANTRSRSATIRPPSRARSRSFDPSSPHARARFRAAPALRRRTCAPRPGTRAGETAVAARRRPACRSHPHPSPARLG
jgi:hypothetical protein